MKSFSMLWQVVHIEPQGFEALNAMKVTIAEVIIAIIKNVFSIYSDYLKCI
jgi:hypothetical protein